jgi:hypothetical protein
VKDDGVWEVERIRDLPIPDRNASKGSDSCQKTISWKDSDPDASAEEDEGEGVRVFICFGCGSQVAGDEAVFADPETGRRSSSGEAHHEDCLPQPSPSCGGEA